MTSPFWGNCPGLCDGLGFCEQRQGEAGTKPFPDACLGLSWSRQDPQNQRNVWFSVFPSKGTCEGSACDAILEDLLRPRTGVRGCRQSQQSTQYSQG